LKLFCINSKAAGSYEIDFLLITISNGISAKGGYASGVYCYKIQTGSFIETKKMILMK